jgi:hypothetical protein
VVHLTVSERATLSNTTRGDLESARSLERMSFLRIERVARNARRRLAFFELTEVGEAYATRHFTIPDRSERADVSGQS